MRTDFQEGASLMAIQAKDPRITLVAGGYPLFAEGKIVGGVVLAAEPKSRIVKLQSMLFLYSTKR